MTPEDVALVNKWIRECDVTWRVFDTGDSVADKKAAGDLEDRLHMEWLPPLSKR